MSEVKRKEEEDSDVVKEDENESVIDEEEEEIEEEEEEEEEDGDDDDDDDGDDDGDNDGDNDDDDDGEGDGKRKPDNKEISNNEEEVKKQKLDPLKAPPGKKVPLHFLEKRRIGRIKAAEEFARKLRVVGIERVENQNLPVSGLFRAVPLVNQKNYSSDYLRKDDNAFVIRERKHQRNQNGNSNNNNNASDSASDTAVADPPLKKETPISLSKDLDLSDIDKTIVIHPGSSTLKIGRATDEEPILVPNAVAVPKKELFDIDEQYNNLLDDTDELGKEFEDLKNELYRNFKERMKYYKRKMQSNAHDQVVSFNKITKPEIVSDKNDFSRVDWITEADKRYYGDDALRCSGDGFIIRKPFAESGAFNLESGLYSSIQDLLGDIYNLLEKVLSEKFSIEKQDYSEYKIVMVIPDLFAKIHVETFIRLLLSEMGFRAVAVMQESLATCYGAGISTPTCVVNIGAEQIRISCVDDGAVLENSSLTLDYGGSDVTRLLAILLQQSNFPYQDWNIETLHGWRTAERLKKDFVTFQDADIAVQIFNYIKRIPGIPSEKYDFKVFDEVILAPLGLFYPNVFKLLQDKRSEGIKKENNRSLVEALPPSRDVFTNSLNDWRSVTQKDLLEGRIYCDAKDDFEILQRLVDLSTDIESLQNENIDEVDNRKCYIPLDKAIVQSITNAAVDVDVSRLSQFYSNIIIVGGGANVPAIDFILSDRINIWRPAILGISSFPNFFKNLNKQLKELQNNTKGSSNPTEAAEDLAKQSKELMQKELNKLVASLEIQNSGDHYFNVSVIPSPRDIDPSVLFWKGASVLAQIKLVEELYITNTDWDTHGNRILQYKCIFTY